MNVSPYLTLPKRSEEEVRTTLVRELKAEGASDKRIAELASDENVKRMAEYERRTIDLIASMFGPKA